MVRPRISGETSDLLSEADRLCGEVFDEGELDVLVPLNGRGNGGNYFTKDSVIKLALIHLVDDLEGMNQVDEDLTGGASK